MDKFNKNLLESETLDKVLMKRMLERDKRIRELEREARSTSWIMWGIIIWMVLLGLVYLM